MDREIVSRLRERIAREGLDAIVAVSPENVTYLTGFVVPSQSLMRWRHAMCLVTVDGRLSMIVIDMEATTVRAHAGIEDLRVYREFTEDPMAKLAEAVRDLKLDRGRIAIEMEYLPAGDFATLTRLAPAASWVAADAIFHKLRQIKTPREQALLRDLSKLTDRAICEALRQAREGMSELDLAGCLLGELFAGGAESYKLMIIASGERSQFPNVGPTERRLRRGDLIRMEIFGQKNGYLAGVCRTAVVGEPTDEQRRIWTNLIECKRLVMDEIRPGAPCKAVYRKFLEKFSSLGFEPISFVGHGIGLFLHEEPYMGRYGDEILAEGMVAAIEPLVYIPGRMGLQNKDMIRVTADGCELLSDYTPTDTLMQVG
ncbi:MAG TPA: Xaa-Pro peptidase family protein [candidate division Zixibacteria bacterium]|nr:Xaa-Pro peptidase family protein [candidate division Zixibacteria bacterium]